jgi:hypothetical protein
MGDLKQAAYNEAQKLAAKQKELANAPSVSPLYSRLAQTGIPVAGASILESEFNKLLQRIEALEQAARNSAAPHQRHVEKRGY